MEIVEFLDHKTRWSVLRGLGNSPVAKATIAVPLVGYLLLFNAEIVKYLNLHADFCKPAGCSSSLRLFLLYLGCCSIAIGAALYNLRCPTLIKKYDSAAAFFGVERDYFCQPRNLQYLLDLIEKGTDTAPLARDAPKFDYGERHEVDPIRLADPMGELYRVLNVKYFAFRLVALISYTVGFGLLLVPTVITFIQVILEFEFRQALSLLFQ
ncbi:hypothetical protein [Neorhizobium sp. T7_12]|uniref:hypothetical protein n=1 Tax=Neorhizobium sp. T7_12 TaxID=2093832 RepID=UPI000CF9A9C7|nr:hypothetical protein [Neorhizobium sp. T7_12]